MASDYGDEAGEKLFDWMMRIGQDAGTSAMEGAADKFASALHHAKDGDAVPDEPTTADKGVEWGKLDMAEFKDIEGYLELKDILSQKFKSAHVEHTFFEDAKTGREYLLFRMEDAPQLAKSFDDLIAQTDKAKSDVRERLQTARGKDKATSRDAQPLDERAAQARQASDALEAERGNAQSRTHEPRFQENRSK